MQTSENAEKRQTTSSNVSFCPQPTDIQLNVTEKQQNI